MSVSVNAADIAYEQSYVSRLYKQLDEQRDTAYRRVVQLLREPGQTPQERAERDAALVQHDEQLARLYSAEEGLCFGRIDLDDGQQRYIGRLGLFDEEYTPLLIDWRAPAAQPFYTATGAARQQVRRRRHLRVADRQVQDLQDEVLNLDDVDASELTGENALLAALNADRTGRMGDIVATIQAEQDRVIRSASDGVLVVDGGPGTGKTAVALHRAAYLLYRRREELATRGVLVVGPNPTFLRYIAHVLPSLGETGVLLATVAQLFPGITATATEPPQVTEVKGRAVMAEVLAAAVADHQRLPHTGQQLELSDIHAGLGYQRTTIALNPATAAYARDTARASGLPHNQARSIFVRQMLTAIARQLADELGDDPYADDPLGGDDAPGAGVSLLDSADVAAIVADLRTDVNVQAALDRWWPVLTPPQLLTDLFADPQRLASAAAERLSPAEQQLLHRLPNGQWTPSDVPLLDEAAELLGDPPASTEQARQREQQRLEYAQGVLDIAAGSRPLDDEEAGEDAEVAAVSDLVSAEQLAQRQQVRHVRTIAELAADDRRWMFGHVIVDEAQELSAMAWRLLMRRCPSRSMTLVGDPAQAGDPAAPATWQQALAPFVGTRWRREQLSVNYRTPAEIMEVAAAVAATLDPPPQLPRPVRRTGVRPWTRHLPDLAGGLAEVVAAEQAQVADGRLAVIVPATSLAALAAAITARVPGAAVGGDPAALDAPVAVLPVRAAKGLEFDSVIVVEPAQILTESDRGANDLYVALTRPTRRLGVVHNRDLPAALELLGQSPGNYLPAGDD